MPSHQLLSVGGDLNFNNITESWARPLLHHGLHLIATVKEEVVPFIAAVKEEGHIDDKDPLFKEEDLTEWIVFTVVCVALLIFDNCVLHREEKALTFRQAVCYTVFYICCAACFCAGVYLDDGAEAAYAWGTGYLLEWMLSLDNLFVFNLVFRMYGTPDELKQKPLFFGIIGAIVFRLVFFIVGETLFHSFWWTHLLFGGFLVYTGIRSAFTDDEDEDPTQNPVIIWISNRLPLVKTYEGGNFFIRVKNPDGTPGQLKATMLFMVVVCLEITDVIFAVDSVSAIIAQIPDLYLAYTACVFAMLGLRATYFVIDELIRMFSLLKYGVSAILVFIGMKLMASKHLQVSNGAVLLILIGTVATCVIASLVQNRCQKDADGIDVHDTEQASSSTLQFQDNNPRR